MNDTSLPIPVELRHARAVAALIAIVSMSSEKPPRPGTPAHEAWMALLADDAYARANQEPTPAATP